MDLFEAIHFGVLSTIFEEGISKGVEEYKNNRELYASLSPEEASYYWSQILECVKLKGKVLTLNVCTGVPSYVNSEIRVPKIRILSTGDDFLGFEPEESLGEYCRVVDEQGEDILLEEDVFEYALDTIKNGLELSERKWTRVYDNGCVSEYGILDDSKLSFYQEIMN